MGPVGPTDEELTTWAGPCRRVPVGGMSSAAVQRIIGEQGSFALKARVTPNELRFYDRHADRLRDAGVDSPHAVATGTAADGDWLLLEWVEDDLPEVRWGPDDAIIATLARLHATPPPTEPADWSPEWTAAMTDHVLAMVGDPPGFASALATLRANAMPCLAATVPVSGDANPRNWRQRGDGTPVLLDWERFCVAGPEVDLAVVLPGLPTARAVRDVAEVWCRHDGDEDIDGLSKRVAATKAWSVVDFLNAPDRPSQHMVRAQLRDVFPPWAIATADRLR